MNLTLNPGTATLIMSGHGGGKSTLLQLLAGRMKTSQYKGKVLYNGEVLGSREAILNPLRVAGYVGQQVRLEGRKERRRKDKGGGEREKRMKEKKLTFEMSKLSLFFFNLSLFPRTNKISKGQPLCAADGARDT